MNDAQRTFEMKFYDCQSAPSPRRARIFIAEKGLHIEALAVDLGKGEQFSDQFKSINPRCTVPVLELDDGTVITENVGIAVYLEAVCPDPPLLGESPTERALVAMWNARAEQEGLWAVAEAFRNNAKGLKNHAVTGPTEFGQIPELAERGRIRAAEFFDTLDQRLADEPFLAGKRYSLADITALCVVDFAAWIKLSIGEQRPNLKRWHDEVGARPSASL